MKKKQIKIITGSTLLVVLLLFAFFPRFSSLWDINEDEEDLSGKNAYLTKLRGYRSQVGKPNILIIMADDLGYYDTSLYGDLGVNTPYLNALAKRGVTFTNATATAPVCSPSRAGMLTGRNQSLYGFDAQPMLIYPNSPGVSFIQKYFINTDEMEVRNHNKVFPTHKQIMKQGIPQSEILLSEALLAAGYSTSLKGKWHLGYGETQYPNKRGFEDFYGFRDAYTLYENTKDSDVVTHIQDLFWEKYIYHTSKNRSSYRAIERNGTVIDEKKYLTDAITDEVLEYITEEKKNNPDQPFFMYASYNAPHTPFQAQRKYYDQFSDIKDENKRIYYAMIANLDDEIGRLLEGIDALGLTEDTLIFFASDNGGASYTKATDNGPLQGGKLTQFDGGLDVPFIISWPGHLSEGTIYKKQVSLADIFTTSLNAAKLPLPEDRFLSGKDLFPYITGKDKNDPHPILFWRSDYSQSVRTEEWKLLLNRNEGMALLFNIKDDPGESINLADKYPEKVNELKGRIDDFLLKCKAPLWPRVMDFKEVIDGKSYYFAI